MEKDNSSEKDENPVIKSRISYLLREEKFDEDTIRGVDLARAYEERFIGNPIIDLEEVSGNSTSDEEEKERKRRVFGRDDEGCKDHGLMRRFLKEYHNAREAQDEKRLGNNAKENHRWTDTLPEKNYFRRFDRLDEFKKNGIDLVKMIEGIDLFRLFYSNLLAKQEEESAKFDRDRNGNGAQKASLDRIKKELCQRYIEKRNDSRPLNSEMGTREADEKDFSKKYETLVRCIGRQIELINNFERSFSISRFRHDLGNAFTFIFGSMQLIKYYKDIPDYDRYEKDFLLTTVGLQNLTCLTAQTVKNFIQEKFIKRLESFVAELRDSDPENASKDIEFMERGLDSIKKKISLLDKYLRGGKMELSEVKIKSIADDIQNAAQSLGIKTVLEDNTNGSGDSILVQKGIFERIFENLVKNAHDVGAKKISIKTAIVPINETPFAGNAYDNSGDHPHSCTDFIFHHLDKNPGTHLVKIDILDDGPGFPEDKLKKVFSERFSSKADTKSEHGLGLGAIADFVADHAGVIRLNGNGKTEKGAHFEIWFPVSSAKHENKGTP